METSERQGRDAMCADAPGTAAGDGGPAPYSPWYRRCHYLVAIGRDEVRVAARPAGGSPPPARIVPFDTAGLPSFRTLARHAPMLAAGLADLATRIRAAGRDPGAFRVAVDLPGMSLVGLLRKGGPAPARALATAALAPFAGWEPMETADIRAALARLVACDTIDEAVAQLEGRTWIKMHIALANLALGACDLDLPGPPGRGRFRQAAGGREALPLLREPRVRRALEGLLDTYDPLTDTYPGGELPSPAAMARALLDA